LILDDVDLLKWHIEAVPQPLARVVLIVVSGLPGTGKSYFSRRLGERVPLAIVETDAMRKVLFPTPTYSGIENARLFRACHALIEDMLGKGIPVLFDATNLVENNRERLYNIAHKTNAKLILVRVEAPMEVVTQRLRRREDGSSPEDNSTADRSVYRRMASSVEPIRRNHFAVDTSRDIAPVIEKIAREVNRWVRV
jgi:predicted kinase